jgi:outer membrane protein assembly factor BamB
MYSASTARPVLAIIISGLACALDANAVGAEPADVSAIDAARQILDATGVEGGLVVHLGCGDGRLTEALSAEDGYLVCGLDVDADNVQRLRQRLGLTGSGGKVSVALSAGGRLPFVDNLVNLIVADGPTEVTNAEMMRALSPGGVAFVKNDGLWTKTVKPWPEEIDQWTHYLHDAAGNAVAEDSLVGPPRHVQWMGAPTWSRNHHTLASISSVVSAAGRVFYIVDEGTAASMAVPSKWSLVARDAFSGVLLWKRQIKTWAWHQQRFRSGPVQLQRTLVAEADRVYMPLGIDAPVSALDAATGEIIETYESTKGAEEIILDAGVLFVVTGSPATEHGAIDPSRRGKAPFPNDKSIVAVNARSGDVLWKWSDAADTRIVPVTLAADGSGVFFQAGKGTLCLDRKTGNQVWRWPGVKGNKPGKKPDARQTAEQAKAGAKKKPAKKKKSNQLRSPGWAVATLVVQDGVVLAADGKRLSALSSEDGKPLWNRECQPGFKSAVDVFVIGGLVWLGPDFAAGHDLRTGQIKKSGVAVDDVWTTGHHHRCYREKATERYILTGKRGIEFLDLASNDHTRNNWIRGTCQYGIMPANGLIYAPSHACGCFMEAKLYGFWALASESGRRKAGSGETDPRNGRLTRGPAYAEDNSQLSAFSSPLSEDWPTLRHDPSRGGSTEMALAAELKTAWQTELGGRISPPVVAEGFALVSIIDAHKIVALDAQDGEIRWTFTAGGRVDAPPTVYRGLALFGSADGSVYCLRLADGKEVWRFRAAPDNLNTVALDQVESVWPVHGNVLVQNGLAYVAAGRSSHLDGGIFLYALDPATGKIVSSSRVTSTHPVLDPDREKRKSRIERQESVQNATDYKTFTGPDLSDAFSMEGATTDVLVGDGSSVYLRQIRFDRDLVRQKERGLHLFSTARLLDDAENHRSHWVLGTGDFSRIPVAYSWIVYNPNRHGSHIVPSYGLMLSFDETTVWGVRRAGGGYQLFGQANQASSTKDEPPADFRRTEDGTLATVAWSKKLEMRPRAMLHAGGLLVLGGMPEPQEGSPLVSLYDGQEGGVLRIVSATDGEEVSESKLEFPPVWDGMAASSGRLYMSASDGTVHCLGGQVVEAVK